MDVRKLWYTYSEDIQYHPNCLDWLIGFKKSDMGKDSLKFYDSAYPNPAVCFLDSFCGNDVDQRDASNLAVSKDVLLWLFLSHVENRVVLKYICHNCHQLTQNAIEWENPSSASPASLVAKYSSPILKKVPDNVSPEKTSSPKRIKRDTAEAVKDNKEQIPITPK